MFPEWATKRWPLCRFKCSRTITSFRTIAIAASYWGAAWRRIEGHDVQEVYDATAEAFEKIRAGNGPFFFWINMERLSSHTSSDDQKLYRSAEELRALEKFDPLKGWKDRLIEEGLITAEQYAKLDDDVKERIRREYTEAHN